MAESPPAKRKKDGKEKQTPPSANAHDFEKFAPHGNITFIVQGETRVRVVSAILKSASPVFAAMLGPNFKEGQTLAKAKAKADGAPAEIALPEDDAEAFGWICEALHCQADTKLWKPGPEMLLKVWIIIEKYDMKKAMQLSIDFWVGEQLNTKMQLQDLWFMALFCVRAQNSFAFKSVTRQLILSANLLFSNLAASLEDTSEAFASSGVIYKLTSMPLSVSIAAGKCRTNTMYLAKLQEARHNAIGASMKFLYATLPDIIFHCGCSSGPTKALSYFRYIQYELDKSFPLISYMDLDVALALIPPLVSSIDQWVETNRCYCATCIDTTAIIHGEISRFLKKEVEGLCLACFDNGGNGICTEHQVQEDVTENQA
ncbi:hypothetical protein ACHAPJ_006202 [Fusarium lateritium]